MERLDDGFETVLKSPRAEDMAAVGLPGLWGLQGHLQRTQGENSGKI